jgi:hypothetical protein
MTWRQQMICRILLMIASLMAENEELKKELRYLSNSITQYKEPETLEGNDE